MLWWNWDDQQRFSLAAVMLAAAATPWLFLGWLPHNWGAFVGGTAWLFVQQLIAWLLFVGLRTGRMPSAYGGSELRAERPFWFWFTGALYALVLLPTLYFVLIGVRD